MNKDRLDLYYIKSMLEKYELMGANHIVVFGAGVNGREMVRLIKDAGFEVFCYCDNNKKRTDTLIDGIPVYSVESLTEDKDKYMFIVSPYDGAAIYSQLSDLHFKNVLDKQAMRIFRILPRFSVREFMEKMPPIGHFYSLYPNFEEINQCTDSIFVKEKELLDLDLNENRQVELLERMAGLYADVPNWVSVGDASANQYRHRLNNPSFSYGDAVALHCMMRTLRPSKWIEVGSGYSSAVAMDTNEYYLSNAVEFTFIEPYPDRLRSLLKENDKVEIIDKKLQEIPVAYFEELKSGDVLFIDSTHVSKVDSDVNYYFFEILPRLKSGVYIHIHDILYPFEYHKNWVFDGTCWNELYMLRAFLQNNRDYEIVYFQNMLEKRHSDIFNRFWNNPSDYHGGSFWMRKK